ncbi:MAG: glutathione S-transferase family protein [Caulobacteraceae bacterium]
MITVFGGSTSRSLRVTWLLEEMGLPYRIRPVDMLSEEVDAEFEAANPAVYIPVLRDGDVTMVESIAIMEYLMARYGPTPLCPAPAAPDFPAYQQFLHLGEAGLATLMMLPIVSSFIAPESERNNWGAQFSKQWVEKRLRLVRRQLDHAPYMAGEAFTAADISVAYALHLGRKTGVIQLNTAEDAYLTRATDRPAFKRALETSEEAFASR